jgi:hypothetical protein
MQQQELLRSIETRKSQLVAFVLRIVPDEFDDFPNVAPSRGAMRLYAEKLLGIATGRAKGDLIDQRQVARIGNLDLTGSLITTNTDGRAFGMEPQRPSHDNVSSLVNGGAIGLWDRSQANSSAPAWVNLT